MVQIWHSTKDISKFVPISTTTHEKTYNQKNSSSSVILFSCRRTSYGSRKSRSRKRRYADDDDDTGMNGVVLFSRECVLLTFFFYFTSNNNCSSLLFHVCSFLVAQVNNIWFTVSSSPAAAFSPCGYNQMVRKPFCCPLNIEVKWPNTRKICRYYTTHNEDDNIQSLLIQRYLTIYSVWQPSLVLCAEMGPSCKVFGEKGEQPNWKKSRPR